MTQYRSIHDHPSIYLSFIGWYCKSNKCSLKLLYQDFSYVKQKDLAHNIATQETPQQIIADRVTGLHPAAAAQLPTMHNIRRNIMSHRQAAEQHQSVPSDQGRQTRQNSGGGGWKGNPRFGSIFKRVYFLAFLRKAMKKGLYLR